MRKALKKICYNYIKEKIDSEAASRANEHMVRVHGGSRQLWISAVEEGTLPGSGCDVFDMEFMSLKSTLGTASDATLDLHENQDCEILEDVDAVDLRAQALENSPSP